MTTSGRSTVVGVFHNRHDAERAVDELERMGFDRDAIGYVRRDGDRTVDRDGDDTKAAETAGGGALTGAVAGGLIGAAAAGLIPGIGPVIAAGALASILTGAAVGAVTGGLAGSLIGAGIPEDEATYYQGEFESGRTIVTVRAGNRYDEAASILRRFGAYDVNNRGMATTSTMGTTSTLGTGAGSMAASGMSARNWDDVRGSYRDRWHQRFGTTGTSRWEDNEPHYRWGWERQNEDRYRGRAWTDVEPEFRRDWEAKNPNSPWEKAKEGVRDAWENATGDERDRSRSVRISETGTDMSSGMGTRTTVTPSSSHTHRYENNRCVDCGDTYVS